MYSQPLRHAVLATALAACGSEEMFQLELGSTEHPASTVAVAQIASDNRALWDPVVVGDLDGDGVTDAVMVAEGNDAKKYPLNLVSDAYVIYGGSAVTGAIAVDTLPHLSELGEMPQVVQVGDVDGDGLADFLVAVVTPAVMDLPSPRGTYLVYGRTTRFAGDTRLGDAGVLLGGGTAADRVPTVAGLGDLDGDGLDDFAIGAVQGADQSSKVFLFYGRAARFARAVDVPAAADAVITVSAGDESDVSRLGDVDGDGRPDFLIGASLVRGRAARIAGTVALGDIATTRFAAAVAPVGARVHGVALDDLDGDGLADFALRSEGDWIGVSWYGGFQLYYGRAGGFPASVEASAADATFAIASRVSVGAIGDGKGHRDLVVGIPGLHEGNGGIHVVRGSGARLAGAIDLSHTTTYVSAPRHAENCDFAYPDCIVHEGLGGSVASAAITGGDRPSLLVSNSMFALPPTAVHGSSYARLYVLSLPAAQ